MAIRIAINGFGRIGRLAFRVLEASDEFEVVAINDRIKPDYMAYLLKYDSIHGPFEGTVEFREQVKELALIVNGQTIQVSSFSQPNQANWSELNVDFVIEATGLFTRVSEAQGHLSAGAKKVVISAPSEDAPMYVMGVNHQDYQSSETIISNASCTTNCLAPIAQLLEEYWGIEEGLMTTIHAATASQKAVDGTDAKDWRGGRAVAGNIIPASTGAAKAVARVIPALKGRLTGMAFRVPTTDVSVVDLTVRLKRATSLAEIEEKIMHASENELKGILSYCQDPVVSSDFIHNSHSSIFDAGASLELNDRFFKLISWYDNEWGYANRIVDLIRHASKSD
jgi:glyceraldehyde 3-phosphate dehydrogenase